MDRKLNSDRSEICYSKGREEREKRKKEEGHILKNTTFSKPKIRWGCDSIVKHWSGMSNTKVQFPALHKNKQNP